MPSPRAPRPRKDWALFLDIDGTLLDMAPRPDAVVVPENLPQVLREASDYLGGALALASGRTLDDIDRLMAPLTLPCAAEHGAILRFADGSLKSHETECAVPRALRERIHAAAENWPGVLVEEKRFTIVMHYRQAPSRRDEIQSFLRAIVGDADAAFEVLPARMAFELRHWALNKGNAVREFMGTAPFTTRRPVFVGDDVTDEDGFRTATALGGFAVDVRDTFDGEPALVRRWIRTFVAS